MTQHYEQLNLLQLSLDQDKKRAVNLLILFLAEHPDSTDDELMNHLVDANILFRNIPRGDTPATKAGEDAIAWVIDKVRVQYQNLLQTSKRKKKRLR